MVDRNVGGRMVPPSEAGTQASKEVERRQYEEDNRNIGGGSSGGCFPKGTKINTPFGAKDISIIQAGDLIYSKNRNSEKLIAKPVLKVLNHKNNKIWKLTFEEGSSIRTTSVHSFHVDGKWKKASKLMEGEQITHFDARGKKCVKTIKSSYESKDIEDVYNLIIKDNYNFIADGGFAHSFSYFRNLKMFLWQLRSKPSNMNYSILKEKIA